jgi:1-acyl-sn-glycerol-3-phosphate acyltransferase
MSEEHHLQLNPKKTPAYYLVASLLTLLSKILFRPSVVGTENIPTSGPVLIVPIHRSNADFAFTLFISPRKVFFMAKDPLFHVPILGGLLIRLGAFPVHRGTADRESLGAAEEVLRQGQALVLFAEGERKEGLQVHALHDGAMFVAARTGATIVPVGIGGSEKALPHGAKFPRPTKIRIIVGTPITPPSAEGRVARSAISAKSEELRVQLERLYHESMGLG